MSSRWDALLDSKPVPLIEHLLEEASKRLYKDLAQWPLPVTDVEPRTARALQPLLEPAGPRPSSGVFEQSFSLARWDVLRDFAAYDDYVRNGRWLEAGLAPTDKPALLFISRWLVEQALELAERTSGRVNRGQLVDFLDRTLRRLRLEAP